MEVTVNTRQFRAVGTSALAAALLALALFVPSASAQPPKWSLSVTPSPAAVGPGNVAGFDIVIGNAGPSNISQLYLTSASGATPVFISDSRCNATGPLYCSFGALNAGASVSLTVAYQTPHDGSTSFAETFQINATGVAYTDAGHSRGDFLSATGTVALSGNANFNGTFTATGITFIGDTPASGRGNPQSTDLSGLPANVPATVEDGITSKCFNGQCPKGIGEWSSVHVAHGASQTSAFKVVLTISGAVIGNVDPTKVVVNHVLDDGTLVVIGDTAAERCTDANTPPAAPSDGCVFAQYDGSSGNLQITVWVFQNGGFKGA